jgi:hypothetical protein
MKKTWHQRSGEIVGFTLAAVFGTFWLALIVGGLYLLFT